MQLIAANVLSLSQVATICKSDSTTKSKLTSHLTDSTVVSGDYVFFCNTSKQQGT